MEDEWKWKLVKVYLLHSLIIYMSMNGIFEEQLALWKIYIF